MPALLPEPTVLAAYLAAVVVIALTPGPDMTLFIGKTLTQGRVAGFAAMLGASSGLLVHTLFVVFGLSALLAASETAYRVLQVAGAAYLLWLAVQAIRHGSAFSPERGARPREPLAAIWLQGLGVNLLNPKIVLFFLTFLPQFVAPGDPMAEARLLALGMLFIVVAAAICAGLILAAGGVAGAFRRSPVLTRVFDWLFAGVLGGFAVRLLLDRR